MGFNGKCFTWENMQDGFSLIKERIDRAVANAKWIKIYPKTCIRHLRKEESDHCPILFQTRHVELKTNRPFRFFQAWTSEASSKQIVYNAWNEDDRGGMHNYQLHRSLNTTANHMRKWNRVALGSATVRIKELEAELDSLQDNEENSSKQVQISEELNIQRLRLKSINKQKSRELWLKLGDRNSKFFHISTLVRRRRNRINAILDEGPRLQRRPQLLTISGKNLTTFSLSVILRFLKIWKTFSRKT